MRMNDEVQIDWLACPEVEAVPGRCGGRPTIKGTRIEPDTILVYEDYGYTPEQTQADYPTLAIDTIRKLRAFAHHHQLTP